MCPIDHQTGRNQTDHYGSKQFFDGVPDVIERGNGDPACHFPPRR
jgi:hypothetical protein